MSEVLRDELAVRREDVERTTRVYHQRQRARVVLFGMRCAFTEPVLAALVTAPQVDLRAVVFPERAEWLAIAGAGPVLDVVRANEIPRLGVATQSGVGSPGFRDALEAIAPDLIVVACFPWRLPAWLLALPAHGCLNVHPSLLPDGRGPEPAYWAFRWGLTETGVTVHVMDGGFDTGPVVAQLRVAIPEEATIGSLERTLARLGADLLIDTLPAVLDGSALATVQAGEPARYAPIPQADDLVVPTSWSARHAARFVRAVVPAYGPVPVLVEASGQRLAVSGVIDVDDNVGLAEPVLVRGSEARIRFSPGMLTCRIATRPQPLQVFRNR